MATKIKVTKIIEVEFEYFEDNFESLFGTSVTDNEVITEHMWNAFPDINMECKVVAIKDK